MVLVEKKKKNTLSFDSETIKIKNNKKIKIYVYCGIISMEKGVCPNSIFIFFCFLS